MLTRSEWVSEFKRYISILPEREQRKAIDYYDELFEDKYDSGMSEKQVVDSFGSPYDAAKAIIDEYSEDNPGWVRPEYDPKSGTASSGRAKGNANYSANTDNSFRPANNYPQGYSSGSSDAGVATLLCVIVGIALYPIAVAISMSAIFFVGSNIIYGIANIISSIGSVISGGPFMWLLGFGLMRLGIGAMLMYPIGCGIKWMFYGIRQLFKVIRNSFVGGSR